MRTTPNRPDRDGLLFGKIEGPAARGSTAVMVNVAMARMPWEGLVCPVVIEVVGPAHEPEVEIPLRIGRLPWSHRGVRQGPAPAGL